MKGSQTGKGPISDYLSDDGLVTPTVGEWGEEKYGLVWTYDKLFATGMKKLWDKRVYIDLFSGPGRARIRGSGKILHSSPLLALDIPDKFDRYIFCERDGESLSSLKTRVKALHPHVDSHFVPGDCNTEIQQIIRLIPKPSPTNKVLCFCFIDPFSLGIDFDTIRVSVHTSLTSLFSLHCPWTQQGMNLYTFKRSTNESTVSWVTRRGGNDGKLPVEKGWVSESSLQWSTFTRWSNLATATNLEKRWLKFDPTKGTFHCTILPSSHVTIGAMTYGQRFSRTEVGNYLWGLDQQDNRKE